jgi:hypothetical protein
MRLVIEQGERAGQVVALAQPTLLIGRGQDSDLVLLEADVSREHARLQHGSQGWTLVDLGTTNGTFVNGRRLPPEDPYLLRPGDRITIGSSVLAVQESAAARQVPAGGPGRAPGRERPAHPLLLLAGALAFVLLLVGIVYLLVTILQPAEPAVTPTAIDQGQQLMTVLPVPTEMQDIIGTVIPALPGLFGVTPTPPPPGVQAPEPPSSSRNPGFEEVLCTDRPSGCS